jgi:integrase
MADNIELQSTGWFAIVKVPKDVQPVLGKTKYLKALGTHSKVQAKTLALPLVARWKAEIRQARAALDDPRGEVDAVTREALRWKEILRQAGDDEHQQAAVVDQIEDAARKIGGNEEDEHGNPTGPDVGRFMGIITGKRTPLKPLLSRWETHLNLTVTPKTAYQYLSDVRKMAESIKAVEDINRATVSGWIEELMSSGVNRKTVKRAVSSAANLYRWMQDSGIVEQTASSPFQGHRILQSERVGKRSEKRQPWKPEDALKLHQAAIAKQDQPLADLIELGAHTGARIEELCSLRIEDVTDRKSLMINEGKTDAAVREVPIHRDIAKLVSRLVEASKDGYLISTNAQTKLGGRSQAIGKRFGRLKTDLGYGPSLVFHSFRHMVAGLLKNAKVPEGIAGDILGHEVGSITYSLYGREQDLKVKAAAINKINPMGKR